MRQSSFRQHDGCRRDNRPCFGGQTRLLYVAAGFYGERGGGDVDADAFCRRPNPAPTVRRLFRWWNRRLWKRRAHLPAAGFRLPGRGDFGKTRAVGENFVFKLLRQIVGQPADGADVFANS